MKPSRGTQQSTCVGLRDVQCCHFKFDIRKLLHSINEPKRNNIADKNKNYILCSNFTS